jgi:uncharacterized RmlC-like cupin family protein
MKYLLSSKILLKCFIFVRVNVRTVSGIEIVKSNQLKQGASTPGIRREVAFESENLLFVKAITSDRSPSGWHHHGEHHVYGYMIRGSLRFEYGGEGKNIAEVGPGDFFHVPPETVHRETPLEEEGQLIIAFVGSGPLATNLEGPEI